MVYKRTYRAYEGPVTNPAWRFLVLQRFGYRAVLKSRAFLVGYMACFFLPVIALCFLYLNQNASVLSLVHQKPGFLKIDGRWFFNFLLFQGVLAGIMTAFVGPSLIAPDLTNGALPMYLSRPITRTEYILGKGLVLGALIGSITFAPVFIEFAVQGSLMGFRWVIDNIYIANGIAITSIVLMAVLILLGLAMSAWVRWRIVSGALILGTFVAGAGFGQLINGVMRVDAGYYLDIQRMIATIARSLFHYSPESEPISAFGSAVGLAIFCALLLLLINRKLRVCEAA